MVVSLLKKRWTNLEWEPFSVAADTQLPTTFSKKFTEQKKFKEETSPTMRRVIKKRLEGLLSH